MEMTINEIINVVLGGGAVGGILKVIRLLERLDTRIETAEKNVISLWEKVNEQMKEISDVGKDLAEERGRREGEHQRSSGD